jgi:HSP20 family protein
MKNNSILTAVVTVLFLMVAIQGVYLFKINKQLSAKTPETDLYRSPVQMQSQNQLAPRQYAAPSQRSSPQNLNGSLWSQSVDDWDPFKEMDEMHQLMNQIFRESFNRAMRSEPSLFSGGFSFEPEMDIKDTKDEYIFRLDLPGIDKDRVKIKTENNQLTISGQREAEKENKDDNGFYRMERSFGSFTRSLPLPEDADTEQMKVESKNGVLTIHLPKIKKAAKTA